MNSASLIKLIDTLVIIFFSLFLVTLTNSIFLNQLGYYASLILLLSKYFLTKKNQFSVTGLEAAFLLFILAEILSSIFSDFSSHSFTNTFKRALLIPIVYVTVSAAADIKRGKLYFKIYLGASLITVLIYLYFAYQHYIMNLYGVTESGPSIFQYPITASEIMSFTVVYLFTFLIHERMKLKNRILIFIFFSLSVLALFSTYKRTGWLGAAFGIFIILLMKKEWRILIPLSIAGVIIFLLQENKNIISVFDYSEKNLKKVIEFTTDGRAYDIYTEDNSFFISDYENGLLQYKDSSLIKKYEFPSPVYDFIYWKDEFYIASLIDSRFILLEKKDDSLNVKEEFISPGFTSDVKVFSDNFYVLDTDSGLTIFRNTENLDEIKSYKNLSGFNQFFIDSSFIILTSRAGSVSILKNDAGFPGNEISKINHKNLINFSAYFNNILLLEDIDGLKFFSVDSLGLRLFASLKELKQIYKYEAYNARLFLSSLNGNIYKVEIENEKPEVVSEYNLGFAPFAFSVNENKIYTSFVQRSRISSIFDPYHPSNRVRIALWEAGWKIFMDHPLFGVGDIDLQHHYRLYKNKYDKEVLGHMHNNFMHILVTLGLFGFVIFIYLLVKIIIVNYRIYNETRNELFLSSFSLGTFGAFAAFLFSGLTELNFGDHEIITLVWFTLGLNIAFYKLRNNSQPYEE